MLEHNKLELKDIKWEDYKEVDASTYVEYHIEDSLTFRISNFMPRFFVLIKSKGKSERQKEELERKFKALTWKLSELIANNSSKDSIIMQIRKICLLKDEFKNVYFEELDNFIKEFAPLKTSLSAVKPEMEEILSQEVEESGDI